MKSSDSKKWPSVQEFRALFQETAFTVITAIFFLRFVFIYWIEIQRNYNLLIVLFLCKAVFDVTFTVIRRMPYVSSESLTVWIIAMIRCTSPLLLVPTSELMWPDVGVVLLCNGLTLQIISLMYLGRSFGIVAANRGIKTKGAYRFVRHPLYSSYVLADLGYILAFFSQWNVGIYFLLVVAIIMSVFVEEDFLMKDEKYRIYAKETRWRLIPGIF